MTGVSAVARASRRRTVGSRAVAAAVLAAGMLLAASVGARVPPAAASCAQPVAAEVVRWADVIVVGRVTEVEDPGASYSPHPVSWTVEVTAVHQGRAPRVIHVASDSLVLPSTGVYVLPLTVQDGRLTGDGCALSGTGPGLDSELARGILAAAGPGHPPVGGEAATALPGYAPIDVGSGWSPTGVILTVIGAALALALLWAAVVGLRRARVEARSGRAATSRPAR